MDKGYKAIVALRTVSPVVEADLVALRREVLTDRSLTQAEAEALFGLDAARNVKPDGWTSFFVEALTDYVVWQIRPTGTLDEAKAVWLIGQANRSNSVTTMALLVNVLAESHRVPEWFLTEVRGLATRNWQALDDVRCGAIPACEAA